MATIVPGDGMENMNIWINLGWKYVSSIESDGQGCREKELRFYCKKGWLK